MFLCSLVLSGNMGNSYSTVAFATRNGKSFSHRGNVLFSASRGTHDDKVEICLFY